MRSVEARYPPATVAVTGLDMVVRSGDLFVLLGPSGGGKTSTLRLIAGLLTPTSGDILFDDVSMLTTPPEKRGAAMVFQEHALLPFRTVAQNVGFGLKLRKLSRSDQKARTEAALEAVQLPGFGGRWPSELSGGQRQRVALARALAVEPRLLLLDEPLSKLDRNLRDDLGTMICDLQRRLSITTVMVTHDQDEAAAMADRVGIMIEGRLKQVGSPAEVWSNPINDAVALFVNRRPKSAEEA